MPAANVAAKAAPPISTRPTLPERFIMDSNKPRAKTRAHCPIRTRTAENSVRAFQGNGFRALTRHSACLAHVPEWPPDMLWPVDPKPPREVDEPEAVDVELVPERLDTSPVETDDGGRRE